MLALVSDCGRFLLACGPCRLKRVSASQGLMLEGVAPSLMAPGPCGSFLLPLLCVALRQAPAMTLV